MSTNVTIKRCLLPAAILLLAAFLLLAQIPAAHAATTWVAPVNISPGDWSYEAYNPEMAIDSAGVTHAVWVGDNGLDNIYYANNAGGSWSEPITISPASQDYPYYNYYPRIAIDSGNHPHVVWHGSGGMSYQIWYAADLGSGWSDPTLLSTQSDYDQYNPQIATDSSGNAHVVWYGYDSNGNYYQVYYATNAGGSWSSPARLSTQSSYDQYDPRIALDSSGNANVAWYGYDSGYSNHHIYYATNAGGSWSSPVNISTHTSYDQYIPQIALDSSGNAYVAWYGYDDSDNYYQVYYATNAGGSWSAPVNISTQSSYHQYDPQIALDSSGNAHVVWYGYDSGYNNYHIYYATNAGGSWSAPVNLSTQSDYDQYVGQIALDSGGNAHVAWYGYDSGGNYYQIYYATNAGGSWSSPTHLSTQSGFTQYNSRILLDSNDHPQVIWYGYDADRWYQQVYYTADTGSGWSAPAQLSFPSPEGTTWNYNPQLAAGPGGSACAVWYGWYNNNRSYQVMYADSTGGSWSTPVRLSTQSGYSQYDPQIALDASGNAHVTWYGYDSGGNYYDVWYSTNAGGSWSAPANLSTQSGYEQYDPQIALDASGNAHVTWYGYDNSYSYYHIYYATNAGGSWSAPANLSTQSGYDQYDPQIALDASGNAHVAWYGYDPSDNHYQAYYSDNAGGSWSAPVNLSTQSSYDQYEPQIALDASGNAHVTWYGYDSSSNHYDVWYATNAAGSWSSPVNLSTQSGYDQYESQIALDASGNAHVAWYGYDSSGNYYEIWYVTNAGGSWSAPDQVSNDDYEYSSYPRIAVGPDGVVRTVWYADDDQTDNEDVFFSSNDGGGWTDPAILSTNSIWNDWEPELVVGPDNINHVAWTGYGPTGVISIWYDTDLAYIVNASVSGGGGTVDPATQQVAGGATATIDISPDEGFHIASVTDNGASVPVADPYVITGVGEDHDVVVTFARDMGKWYLAEGCTLDGFETWILVENPGDAPAKINMAFDTDSGEVVLPEMQNLTVPAHSRSSWNLASYIQTYDVATRVTSDSQVVCERAMYGNDRAWATCSVGSTKASDTWYLPEGCTGDGFESWILVQNPNDSEVHINFALDTEIGKVANARMQDLVMPAHTRASWNLADYHTSYDVATVLTSEGGPVVAERSMYAPDRAWAHNSIGTPEPGFEWYLAEGCTVDMETWVLVQNPNGTPVEVDITYLTESGEVAGPQDEVIAPFTRRSFNAGDTVQSFNVSTIVTSEYGPVAVERSMYNPERTWGTCSIGTTSPATTWFLAEGCTDGMDTWVLVANPGTEAATVSLTLDTGEGQQAPAGLQNINVPAGSRVSFRLNDFLTTYNVSTRVTSDKPVVCERAMYGPDKVWADASIGFAQ